jgi:phosphate transport system protein
LFATQNPVAKDLRFVLSTIKINYNYERMGDQANGIAGLVNYNKSKPDKNLLTTINFYELIEVLLEMMNNIIQAYKTNDTQLARTVFNKDLFIDDINTKVAGHIADYVQKHPENAIDALNLLSIIRKIERIGDHITNIAEEIIFYVEGKVLKHGKKDIEEI